jgi:hypothetical protein
MIHVVLFRQVHGKFDRNCAIYISHLILLTYCRILPMISRSTDLDCLVENLSGLVNKLLDDEIKSSLALPSSEMCSSSSVAAIRVVRAYIF